MVVFSRERSHISFKDDNLLFPGAMLVSGRVVDSIQEKRSGSLAQGWAPQQMMGAWGTSGRIPEVVACRSKYPRDPSRAYRLPSEKPHPTPCLHWSESRSKPESAASGVVEWLCGKAF